MGFILGAKKTSGVQQQRYSGIQLQKSMNAIPVAVVFGTNRISPNLIYYTDFTSETTSQGSGGGGKGGGGGGSVKTVVYYATVILAVCEGAINSISTVWIDRGKYATWTDFINAIPNVNLFTGAANQSNWAYLVSNHPTDAYYYHRIAYIAINKYQLTSSAGLPNHSFLVNGLYRAADTYPSLFPSIINASPADILYHILSDTSYGMGINTSLLTNIPYNNSTSGSDYFHYCAANDFWLGAAYDSQQKAHDTINYLMQMTNSAIIFSEGMFKAIPYGDILVTGNGITYDPTNNIADIYDFGMDDFISSGNNPPVELTRRSYADSYNHVRVEFIDAAHNYNVAIAEAKDQANIDVYGLRTMPPLRFHEITDVQRARNIAQLILQRTLYIRNTYKFKVGIRHMLLEPMDVVTITDSTLGLNKIPVRITEITENEDYTISITAEEFPANVSTHALYSTQSNNSTEYDINVAPGNVNAPIFFEPPNRITHDDGELWIALSGGANWGGCQVWASQDNSTYAYLADFNGKTRMGVLSAALNNYTGFNPDTTNTLSVDLTESAGTLASSPYSILTDYDQTLCFVDGELIAYVTATLTSANKYNLTKLYRGLYGTLHASHASGSNFFRLDGDYFKYPYRPLTDVGKTFYFKFLSYNSYGNALQTLASVSSYSYTIAGSAITGGLFRKNPRPIDTALTVLSDGGYTVVLGTDKHIVIKSLVNFTTLTLPIPNASVGSNYVLWVSNQATLNLTIQGTINNATNYTLVTGNSIRLIYSPNDSTWWTF